MKKFNSFETQLGESVVLTDKAKLSLYKKSQNSGYSVDILEEVYRRGYNCWTESFGGNANSFAFDRVNSFIAGGFAVELDEDLKKACWKGYEAVGMKMKNGKKVPNCVPVKEEDAEKHSKDFRKPASRFDGSDELVAVYKKETPGQLIKRVVREYLEEGDVIHTKFAVKNLQKRGIEGPHKAGAQDLMRNWAKHPFDWEADDKVSYHGTTARIHKDGKHIDVDAGAHGIDPDIKTKIIRKQAAKKTGNVVKIKEAAVHATTAPAPTAAATAPTRLGGPRTAPTYQASTIGNQGLNQPAPNTFSAKSGVNPRGLRSMTSGQTQATAKTLTPQRVSANQPAPKTASAPASAPKPSASFGSSSRPTTVSATSGGVEKSGGYKLSSGMSDAGKAKVKPTAPVQIPAGAGKAVNVLSKVAKFAGPVGAAVGLVADAKPLNKGEDEFARQKSLGITKPNVTPGMGSTKNIEPVKGGAITTKAPDYYKGKVGDYTVKAGDTLSGIAAKTGQSVADLASKNKFDSENKIAAGAKLFTGDVPTAPKRPETESGGKKK